MWYVYVLKSKDSKWHYVGSTGQLKKRVEQHNQGLNQSTKHYAPFELEAYIAVKTEAKAREWNVILKQDLVER